MKKRKPPYVGQLFVALPDKTEKKVALPKAEDYEMGARVVLTFKYKGLNAPLEIIRVDGGWDVYTK